MKEDVEDDQFMKMHQQEQFFFQPGQQTPQKSLPSKSSNFNAAGSNSMLTGGGINIDTSDSTSNGLSQTGSNSNLLLFNFNEDYIPESPEFDMERLRNSEIVKRKRYVDALYYGEMSNGKRHGIGIMKYKNGRVYEGDWYCDLRHGKGLERYANGNFYHGDFDAGKAHGRGIYNWVCTGEIYDGEWHRGQRVGYGMWRNLKGDSYMGQWMNGRAEGYGVHNWENGDKYEGEWKNCVKHGRGADMFGNKDVYRGEYRNGKPEGKGVYQWANGSNYEGDFEQGLKHGHGKWKKGGDVPGAPTNLYIGEYKNDKKNGQGEFRWASGNLYRGLYKDDERHGHGEMVWTDGSQYVGQWSKGIQNGCGKMHFQDGSAKEGYFENNVYIGHLPPQPKKVAYKTPIKLSNKKKNNSSISQQSLVQTLAEVEMLTNKRMLPVGAPLHFNGGSVKYKGITYSNSATNLMNKRTSSKSNSRQQKEHTMNDKQSSENIHHKLENGSFNRALRASQSNGFQSAVKLKKRLESPDSESRRHEGNQISLPRANSGAILKTLPQMARASNPSKRSLVKNNENNTVQKGDKEFEQLLTTELVFNKRPPAVSGTDDGRKVLAMSKKAQPVQSHRNLPRHAASNKYNDSQGVTGISQGSNTTIGE